MRTTFVPNREPKNANPLGLASFVFGLLALLVCWIPLLNLVAFPLAAIGATLGLIGLLVGLLMRGVLSYALIGTIFCAASCWVAWNLNHAIHESLRSSVIEARAIRAQEEIDRQKARGEFDKPADEPNVPAIPPPPAPDAP
jgi:hypothetical protein